MMMITCQGVMEWILKLHLMNIWEPGQVTSESESESECSERSMDHGRESGMSTDSQSSYESGKDYHENNSHLRCNREYPRDVYTTESSTTSDSEDEELYRLR